jgi:hypothetical protein
MSSVVLVIIHNHPHYANIATLDRLYGSRFRHIRHLAPFYTGPASHVVPVYENSRFFQGYVSQAVSQIVDDAFDHYLFVADDLLLRPDISEDTYRERLRLWVPRPAFFPDSASSTDSRSIGPGRPRLPAGIPTFWVPRSSDCCPMHPRRPPASPASG